MSNPGDPVPTTVRSATPPDGEISRPSTLESEHFIELNRFAAWAGPLPPPSLLAEYEHVQPGLGTAMARAFLDEGNDRRQIRRASAASDLHDVRSNRLQSGRGQVFGFVIGITSIVLGFTAVMCGHDWAGAVIGGGGLAGIVSVFVTGRHANHDMTRPSQRDGGDTKKI